MPKDLHMPNVPKAYYLSQLVSCNVTQHDDNLHDISDSLVDVEREQQKLKF